MKTDIKSLRDADWNKLEQDVVARIRLLKAAVFGIDPGCVSDLIANDLILPNLSLLAEFCSNIHPETDE